MENLNQAFFLWLNASDHPHPVTVAFAIFLADWLIWVVPMMIGICWLRGSENTRKAMLLATAAGLIGLAIGQGIGLVWTHPRPFMIGLGHTLIPHVADSSFPSDHLTLWWAVAVSLWLHPPLRRLGISLFWFGLLIAWARIYLGVHFPLDMVGAAVVGAFSACLASRASDHYLEHVYQLANRIHQALFGKLIAIGWVRK